MKSQSLEDREQLSDIAWPVQGQASGSLDDCPDFHAREPLLELHGCFRKRILGRQVEQSGS